MTTHHNQEMGIHSEEHMVRVQKVKTLQAMGIEPWPAVKQPTTSAQAVLDNYTAEQEQQVCSLVGRVVAIRLHGKAAFAHIQDNGVRLQLYFKEELVGAEQFAFLEKFIDLGDILYVAGVPFTTQKGEISLRVQEFSLQSKCLFPLPEKFHGLTDIETRYRQRYLDLIANHASRDALVQRSKIVQAMRAYLTSHNYLEVETPMLHPIAGGAAAKPFVTHHNALSQDFFLRIAPELYLKRLVVGGLDRVFEINRNFRNEGISTRHNPEFTMLEFYTAHQDYNYAMDFVESMIKAMVQDVHAQTTIQFGMHTLDFSKPFERIKITDAVQKYNNLSDDQMNEVNLDALIDTLHIERPKSGMTYNEKIYLLFEETVESKLIQPTYAIGFPIEVSPLAKRDAHDGTLAARAELFVAGMEISNLFNELNDPFDQAERFMEQVRAHEAGDEEAHQYDAEFIHALEYGLPPTVGVGVGIDRLVMVLTGMTSIKDIILFPTLKKKD